MGEYPVSQATRRRPQATISVVLPVYNEEANIPAVYTALNSSFGAENKNVEFVFINDGRGCILFLAPAMAKD